MFSVGEKVVCFDSSMQPHTVEELKLDCPNWVKKDAKYTIRAIIDHDFVVGVLLEEISNPLKYFKVVDKVLEPAFASWRFRKLKEDEVTVEQLTEELCY